MLVLTRKVNESILVGDDIKISLLGLEGDRAKIGIDAPAHLRIFRLEMLEKTIEENKSAVTTEVDLRVLSDFKQKYSHRSV